MPEYKAVFIIFNTVRLVDASNCTEEGCEEFKKKLVQTDIPAEKADKYKDL